MSESLWTSDFPGGSYTDGAPGIVTALTVKLAVEGVITHVRWWVAAGNDAGTWTGNVWEVTNGDAGSGGVGSLKASKVFVGTIVAGWNLIALDTPVPVVTDKLYRVGIHNSAGRYAASNFAFGSPVSNGNILAPADSTDPLGNGWLIRQGTFQVDASSTVYPASTGSQANYGVDLVFQADSEEPPGPTITVWNGTAEVAATAKVWDGSTEVTSSLSIV